jgi:hypothetical protein
LLPFPLLFFNFCVAAALFIYSNIHSISITNITSLFGNYKRLFCKQTLFLPAVTPSFLFLLFVIIVFIFYVASPVDVYHIHVHFISFFNTPLFWRFNAGTVDILFYYTQHMHSYYHNSVYHNIMSFDIMYTPNLKLPDDDIKMSKYVGVHVI